MRFTIYKNSLGATVLSFTGASSLVLGVTLLVGGLSGNEGSVGEWLPGSLVCIAIGLLLGFLAEKVSIKKTMADNNADQQSQPEDKVTSKVRKTAKSKAPAGSTSGVNSNTQRTVNPQNEIVKDTVFFGAYKQDNNNSSGKIEWQVIDQSEQNVLLISKYALACKQFNTEGADVTWETSSLRAWLNGEFIYEAFSREEQAMILEAYVPPLKNSRYNTDPGRGTKDKIFLLSEADVSHYFSSNNTRACKPAKYAIAEGVLTDSGCGTCRWWLRTPGTNLLGAAIVNFDGSVVHAGNYVAYDKNGVRPALWIKRNS